MLSDMTTIFCSQHRANMRAILFDMGNDLSQGGQINFQAVGWGISKQDTIFLWKISEIFTIKMTTASKTMNFKFNFTVAVCDPNTNFVHNIVPREVTRF